MPSTTKTFSNTTIFALAAFCLPFRLGEAEHCVCGISSHGLEEGGGVAPGEKVSSRARPPLPTTSSSTLHPPALERDGNSRRHLSLFNHPPIPLLSQPVSFLRCLKIALFLIIGSEGGSTIFLTYFVLFGFGQTHMHSCSLGLVCSFPTSNLFVNSVRIGGAAAAASLLSGDCCQNNFLLPNHISWSSPLAFSNLQFSGLFCGHSLWLISKKAPRSNQRKPKLIALCWSNKKTRYNFKSNRWRSVAQQAHPLQLRRDLHEKILPMPMSRSSEMIAWLCLHHNGTWTMDYPVKGWGNPPQFLRYIELRGQ